MMEAVKDSSSHHKKDKEKSKHKKSSSSSSGKKKSKHRHRDESPSSPSHSASKRKHSSDDEEDADEKRDSDNEKERKPKHSTSRDEKSSSKKHRHEEKGSEKREKDHKREKESSSKAEKVHEPSPPPAPSSSNGDSSLSIEETNKLRAKLGLKPLSVSENKPTANEAKPGEEQGKKTYIDKDTNQEFEHVPAKNLAQLREQKELRQKLQEQREKRLLGEKLRRVKGIADSDEEKDESAHDWLKKIKEKEEAQRKARLLEEMDAQFGVGDLVESTVKGSTNKPKQAGKDYSSDHLSGLRVEHDQSAFKEGQEVILTLKDKAILKGTGDNLDLDDDEDGDVLVNVNIVDQENANKNVENKKKKPDYKAYDEFDEEGIYKEKSILDKYNEELNGEQKKSFRLGARGTYDASDEKFLERLDEAHKSRAIKLDTLNDLRLATDYFTPQELEKFKKPKKVRRVLRKNKMVKADDLVPLASVTTETNIKKERAAVKLEPAEDGEIPSEKKHVSLKDIDFGIENESANESDSEDDDEEDELEVQRLKQEELKELRQIIEDENNALEELHNVLSKTRQRATAAATHTAFAAMTANEAEAENGGGVAFESLNTIVEENEDALKNSLTMDTMSEFCRNLGSLRNKPFDGSKIDQDEEAVVQSKKMEVESEDESKSGSDSDEHSKSIDDEKTEGFGLLDEEPIIDRGLASALQLAGNKGYVEHKKTKQNARYNKASIEAIHYTVEEKHYYDIDDKYNRNRDRFSGPLTDFTEKPNYKPEVKLDYIDEKGHAMNEKEAFRYLSHRFHGKGSGKKKTEKMIKKTKEADAKNKMSSVDTPLNTVALLVEKQKKLQQPFVVLSAPKGKQDQVTLHKR